MLEAEEALLGACLMDERARSILVHELAPADFYSPANGIIADAVVSLHRAGSAVDTVTVSEWLGERGLVDAAGGPAHLVACLTECPATTGAGSYARLIAERATRRQMIALADGWTEAAYDLSRPVDATVTDAAKALRAMDLPAVAEGPDHVQALLDLECEYEWVVPNLLERGDRLMVTAAEGRGKSSLLAQMAVQFSAGIHPFKNARTPALRVLVVDVENHPNLVSRRFAGLIGRLPKRPMLSFDRPDEGFDLDRLRVRVRPEGIDLLSRNDRRWFTERVMVNEPDVVITGPIYKLHRAEATDEVAAQQVAAYFDELRSTYRCCLILEAHSPYASEGAHRTLRPFGPSLWSRWPEFGFGMRLSDDTPRDSSGEIVKDQQIVDWVPWRGARDEGRDWPHRLRRGGRWPWTNAAQLQEQF